LVSADGDNPDRDRFQSNTGRNMQVHDEGHVMVCLWANIDTHWPDETVLNVDVYVGQANEV